MFIASSQADGDETERISNFLLELQRLQHPALNAFPEGPMIGINLHAPISSVLTATEDLVKQWKVAKDIPDQRRRDDKLEEYLAVWDLREGWSGDHYDVRHERSYLEIGQQLHISTSTAHNRYRSAFKFIVGHDFTSALWSQVIGFLKILDWPGPSELPRRSLRRRWRDPVPNLAPEAALQPSLDGENFEPLLNATAISRSDIDDVTFAKDLLDLIAKGWPNERIIDELDMRSPEANELIDYLRNRQADPL